MTWQWLTMEDSIHAVKQDTKAPTMTFDAAILISKIDKGSNDEEKWAYIELEFFDKSDFMAQK